MDFSHARTNTYMVMSFRSQNAIAVCHIGDSVGMACRKSHRFWTEHAQSMLAPEYARVDMVQAHTESIQHSTQILSIPLHRICIVGRAKPLHRRRRHSHFDSDTTRVGTRLLATIHSTYTFSNTIDTMASREHLRRHRMHLSTNA